MFRYVTYVDTSMVMGGRPTATLRIHLGSLRIIRPPPRLGRAPVDLGVVPPLTIRRPVPDPPSPSPSTPRFPFFPFFTAGKAPFNPFRTKGNGHRPSLAHPSLILRSSLISHLSLTPQPLSPRLVSPLFSSLLASLYCLPSPPPSWGGRLVSNWLDAARIKPRKGGEGLWGWLWNSG